MRSHYMNKEY